MSCTPNNSDRLTLPQMRQFIDSFAEVCVGSGVVVFTGGECTLLGDDLLEAIAYANSLGLFTRIVTNAWWAKSERDAETFLDELKSCGLDEINISCDDFHAEYIPLENVRNLWNSAKTMGFKLSALRSAEITTVQSARHTCASTLMKTFHSCISSTIIPASPRASPLHHGFRHHANWARTKSQSQPKCATAGTSLSVTLFRLRPRLRYFPKLPSCTLLRNKCRGTWLFDLGKINLTDDINELQLLLLNYIQYIGPGGLLKHLRTSGGLSSFGRSSYLSQCEICEDIALSKEAKTCLAKLAPKLAADLIVETKFETTFIGNGSDIHD